MFLKLSIFKQQLLFKQNRRFVSTTLLSRSRNSKPFTLRWRSVILIAPGIRQPERLAGLARFFSSKTILAQSWIYQALLSVCKTLLLWWKKMFLDVWVFLRESLALSHEIHYPQILLAPNVGRFCLSNKCSSNTRWCDNMSFYLQFGDRNNRSVLFLRFLHCNLNFDIVSVSRFFPNFMLVIILESDLPLIATFLNSY